MFNPFPVWVFYTICSHISNLPLILFTIIKEMEQEERGMLCAERLSEQKGHLVWYNLVIMVMVKGRLSPAKQFACQNQASLGLLSLKFNMTKFNMTKITLKYKFEKENNMEDFAIFQRLLNINVKYLK